uniref:No apical meristem-associated C-terminal domain-containing protein n=1 Tax=Tanacetum cinerariifolium TaxID=118510 RepID=A0A699IRH8_TANCI|nr:hypothetical protein [Tanacetum cinerariifolium]
MTVVQIEDAPRCTTWTHEEEIALCKGWVHVSENSFIGNAKKVDGFGLRCYGTWWANKATRSLNVRYGEREMEDGSPERNDDEDDAQELQRPIGRDKAKGSKKKGARSSRSSSSMNDEALARLMVSELVTHNERAIAMKKEECTTFLEMGGGVS